jgi:hypothetical protein
VDDTVRVLATAAVLTASGLAVLAWRITRIDPAHPDRLVGELRLAQMAAVVLAGIAGAPVGLAVSAAAVPGSHLDIFAAVALLVLAGFSQLHAPRDALLLLSVGFVLHALIALAHRPGWLPPDLMPRWYAVGTASHDLCLAAICFLGRRR